MSSRDTQVLIFTKQFASMIKSHLPLVDVLDNLAAETPDKKIRETIEEISDDVKHGIDLGDAMVKHNNIFSDIYINVVKAGMASGKLGPALVQIYNYLEVMHEVSRNVRGAMTYPIFMLIAFFGVFNGMIFFILPKFSAMFKGFNKELPAATQVLLALGDFWMAYWYLVIGGFVFISFLFVTWKNTEDGRAIWDNIKLKIPLIGGVWRMGALARFLRTLSVQVQNDVPLLEALVLSADAAGNVYVRETLDEIASAVERGESVSDAFRSHEIFHGIVLQMIKAGEETGALDELLLSSADYFDSLLRDRLTAITGLINPILTVFIGLAVAGMMIAAFLPVFEMGSAVG